MKEDKIKSFEATSNSKSVRLLCSSDEILSHIFAEIQNINSCLSSRLTSLELKVSVLVQTCNKICSTMDNIEKTTNGMNKVNDGLVYESTAKSSMGEKEPKFPSSNKLKLVPLTNQSDYPNGSWLGDPKIPTNRVRCQIPPAKLFHIDNTCLTPIKMALTLLDNLFTKEELAFSNISGKSRKGKKQLSPILIFAIKCHLQYKFGIPEKEWIKIGQNIDAKCRFAYKKRNQLCGKQDLKLKLQKQKHLSATTSTDEISFDFDNLNHSDIDFNSCVKVITENPCELRIVNATPAQLAHLQESQEIIIAEEMLPDSNERKHILINSPEVSMSMNSVVINGDDEELGSHLTIPSTDVHIKVESMEVDNSKEAEHHTHHLHQITMKDDQNVLTIHDVQLEDGLHLEAELDSRSED